MTSDGSSNPTRMDRAQARSFVEVRMLVHRFESVMESYGIAVKPDSRLGDLCLELQDLEDKRLGRSRIQDSDYRRKVSEAIGLLHLIELIIHLADMGRRLDPLIPHMRLLVGKKECLISQNVPGTGSGRLNKLFELLMAVACMRFAKQLTLDDPDDSKGDNADVLFTHDDTRWALACKVPNGPSPESACDNVISGIAQIDRSDVEEGIVILNARNWIDHDALWPPPGKDDLQSSAVQDIHWAHLSLKYPESVLEEEARKRFQAMLAVGQDELIEAIGRSTKAVPAVLMFFQSSTVIVTDRGPTLVRIGKIVLCPLIQPDPRTVQMTMALHDALFRQPVISGLR